MDTGSRDGGYGSDLVNRYGLVNGYGYGYGDGDGYGYGDGDGDGDGYGDVAAVLVRSDPMQGDLRQLVTNTIVFAHIWRK